MPLASLGGGSSKLLGRGIRQDLVKLLLQDLKKLRKRSFSKREVEKTQISTNTRTSIEIQRKMEMHSTSTKIRREVKVMTEFLTAIEEWENQVLNCLFKIKRFFQKYRYQNQNEDEFLSMLHSNNNYLQGVLADIEKLRDEVPKIDKMRSNEPLENKAFEVGESSKSNTVDDTDTKTDDGFINFVTDTQQRNCLRSLAIFPENTELKKRQLINWWVGLGILPFEGDARAMENRSTEIFSQLEKNHILKPKQIREHDRAIKSYTINFRIHKQLISDFKREGRIVSEDMKEEDPLHVYKVDGKGDAIAVLNLNQKHLTNSKYISGPAIKVALLGKWHYTDSDVHDKNKETIYYDGGTKFFQKMGEAMTYLSLRGISRITELPQSVGRIISLKILDLKDCHSLQKLPEKPKSSDDPWFKELMHLDITGCYLLGYMPKWVCELSNLQVLKGAMFNCFLSITNQCRLKDLSKLQKLVKLSIKIIHPEFLSSDDCTGLKSLCSLLVLTIVWNFHKIETKKQGKDNVKDSTNSSGRVRRKMVDKKKQSTNNSGVNEDGRKIPTIIFPENLEKLDIRCYPNAEAPELSNAAKLKNLKRLYIRGGKLANIKEDADWQVEILRLRFLECLAFDWYELRDIFPKLQCVEYEKCPRVKFFTRDSGNWNKEINGPFLSHTGPFNDDEPPAPSNGPSPVHTEGPRVALSIETLLHDRYYTEALLKLSSRVLEDPSKEPLDLVMVLDIRRSVGRKELEIMKAAVISFIKDLIKPFSFGRVSIVTFGTHAKRQCGLLLLTENCQTKLEKLIGSFEASGFTHIYDGVEMGLKVLTNRTFRRVRRTCMMLISGSEYDADALRYNVPILNHVSVHTFGINGCQDYDYDRTALKYITAESRKGTFTEVSNKDDLLEALHKCRRLLYSVEHLTLTINPEENVTLTGHDHGSLFLTVRFGKLLPEEVCTRTIQLHQSHGHQDGLTKAFTVEYSYSRFGEFMDFCRYQVWNDWPNQRLMIIRQAYYSR